jgi:hypothetical protein
LPGFSRYRLRYVLEDRDPVFLLYDVRRAIWQTSVTVEQPEEPFVRCPRLICGFEEEDVSYHMPPAIKRTKPMPTIAATTSISGERFENLEKVVVVLLVPLRGSPEGPNRGVAPVLAKSVFTRVLSPPPLGPSEMTAIQKEI